MLSEKNIINEKKKKKNDKIKKEIINKEIN